jgi:hypothetical protein
MAIERHPWRLTEPRLVLGAVSHVRDVTPTPSCRSSQPPERHAQFRWRSTGLASRCVCAPCSRRHADTDYIFATSRRRLIIQRQDQHGPVPPRSAPTEIDNYLGGCGFAPPSERSRRLCAPCSRRHADTNHISETSWRRRIIQRQDQHALVPPRCVSTEIDHRENVTPPCAVPWPRASSTRRVVRASTRLPRSAPTVRR